MTSLFGILITFVAVFGGYSLAGGNLTIILNALPFELIMIGGAALGSFLIVNDIETFKSTIKDIQKVFKEPRWNSEDYNDLIRLFYDLTQLYHNNPIELESELSNYQNSKFKESYPKILDDQKIMDVIADTFRSASVNLGDTQQIELALKNRIKSIAQDNAKSGLSLQSMADSLPALGIVAAVLGVIKTMTSIDQPPEILGQMIAGALVGTFLGIFLSYCCVGPLAKRILSNNTEEHNFLLLIQNVLIATLRGEKPKSAIESGRQQMVGKYRVDYSVIQDHIKA